MEKTKKEYNLPCSNGYFNEKSRYSTYFALLKKNPVAMKRYEAAKEMDYGRVRLDP